MDELQVPTLGGFVRTSRERAGWSRQELASAIHSSLGYIAKIEQGGAVSPSPSVLDALAEVFPLGRDERLHLYRLARQHPDAVMEATAGPEGYGLRSRATLDALAPHLAAFTDHNGNLFDSNEPYREAFPGIRRAGNVLRWLFTDPRARLVVEEWEQEARMAVGCLRHYAAQPRDPRRVRALLDELGAHPDFRRHWTSGAVAVDRPDPIMRLRRPRDGTVYEVRIEQYRSGARHSPSLLFVGLFMPGDG